MARATGRQVTGSSPQVRSRRPSQGHPDLQGPHVERTISSRSGVAGSFVRNGTRKSWTPPIPGCIMNSSVRVVVEAGAMVVCPTTASGGQQPATTRTRGVSVSCNDVSPAFVSVNTTRAGVSKR